MHPQQVRLVSAVWHAFVIGAAVLAGSVGAGMVSANDAAPNATDKAPASQPLSPPRALAALSLENVRAAAKLLSYVRFFHPSDEAVATNDWGAVAVRLVNQAEPATDSADLTHRLLEAIAPIAPTVQVWAGDATNAPPPPPPHEGLREILSWRHFGPGTLPGIHVAGLPDVVKSDLYSSAVQRTVAPSPPDPVVHAALFVVKPLAGGVTCRIPIGVYADERGTLPRAVTAPRPDGAAPPPMGQVLAAVDRSTRLADVALAWGVFQHFYPNFDVVETDWDAALTAALASAADDADEAQFLQTLEELVARLHDGQGRVSNLAAPQGFLQLPIAFTWAGDELVVGGRGRAAPQEVALGDVVLDVDGRPVAEWIERASARIGTATEGWRRVSLARALQADTAPPAPTKLRLRRGDGSEYTIDVSRVRPSEWILPPAIGRPCHGTEAAPGIVYFDFVRPLPPGLLQAMPSLESARGLVFDLRGATVDQRQAMLLIQHLIDVPVTSAPWYMPVVTRPDREGVTWKELERSIFTPLEPRLRKPVAFVTDGRAAMGAESILDVVEAYKLGEIVGSTTAGINGNRNAFELPGGYVISWTTTKVLKHDGSRRHGVGVAPTVPVSPTAKGIADGRDEVLERAIEVVRSQIDQGR